jgi:hypothetical protein
MSATRAARRAAERRMRAAGVELVSRSHLPLIYGTETSTERKLALLSGHIDDALVKLAVQGADLDGMLAITIGEHPSFPGTVTVEAKAASRKALDSSPEDAGDESDGGLLTGP